ncbi:MAG: hypothetical protein R2873_36650, partial [Caldilineaceae bacterium]
MAVASEQKLSTQSAPKPPLLARIVGVRTNYQAKQALWGYVFALPWIIGLLVFWGGPIVASASFSFTNYEIIGNTRWLGMANYVRAFTK